MRSFAPLLDHEPPLEHDVFRNRQDTLFEHRAHFMRKPIIQFAAMVWIGDEFYANLISARVTELI